MIGYDSVIIGCGFAGATAARELAEAGKRVLILEQRDHIGGNAYDCTEEHGILVHRYGPHIFHTNIKRVYDYLSRFTEWYPYQHEVAAKIDGEYLPVPFNFHTLVQVYGSTKGEMLKEKLISRYGEGTKVPILKLREDTDPGIQEIAEYVYENIFLKYTMKQWGQTPEEIDPSVSGRVPISLSYDDRYFQDTWQGMPKEGYTRCFERMLEHDGIEVRLSARAEDFIQAENGQVLLEGKKFEGPVIFTGALDEFFGCRYGRLPYRSLDFVTEYYETRPYQCKGVINYTVSEDFTRITEYPYLTGQETKGTAIMKEYPKNYSGAPGEIPYYAILDDENRSLYEKYVDIVRETPNFYLLGRLAEYQYYNMDAIIDKALCLTELIKKEGKKQ